VVVLLAMASVAMVVVRVGDGDDNKAVREFDGFNLLENV